jgi:RNA polymerase sigma-70 factor (ECF subfamily)
MTALQQAERRTLPSGLGAPDDAAEADAPTTRPEGKWLEPIPDALITPESEDPSAVAQTRASVRLALVASFQHLPARQRAVVILRDVVELPAAEVARMLDTSTAAVKSSLQRARARLIQIAPRVEDLAEPSEPQALALLNMYVRAFEQGDMSLLDQALHVDAILEMTSSGTWFAGKQNCLAFIRRFLDTPGEYRMLPTGANGQPAVAAYRRGEDGVLRAFALVVLSVTTSGIARITLFHDTDLFARFAFPPVLVDE